MVRTDFRFAIPEYIQYAVETVQNVVFNKYRTLWYENKKKKIPFETFTLTPLALAIWFMDDGSRCPSGYVLATNSFSIDEITILRKLLLNIGINTSLRNANNNQFMIYIKSDSVSAFNNLIIPYIHESMNYKLILDH